MPKIMRQARGVWKHVFIELDVVKPISNVMASKAMLS